MKKRKHRRFQYDLIQDGIIVASVDASTDEEAKSEIGYYALMYAQDGPVKVVKIP